MKEIKSSPEDFNIYCTAADSTVHSLLECNEQSLLRQIKLCSLLGEYVYISCSHIYENVHTRNLLINNPKLLTRGLIAIGLRDDCRDFTDLQELREHEGRNIIPDSQATTNFLNRHTDVVIRWTPMDMQPQFKSNILHALQNPNSLLRRRLTFTLKSSINNLSQSISDLPNEDATRTNMHDLAKEYIPHRVKAFMREVNLLYYVMGASDRQLKPHLSPLLFGDLTHGYKTSSETEYIDELPYDNWLDEMLRAALFPTSLIDQLTIDQIARVKADSKELLRRFRSKWWSSTSIAGAERHNGNYQDLVIQRIHDEIKQEKKQISSFEKARRLIGLSSLVLSAVSIIPHPAIAALSFLVSAGAFTASSDNIKYRLAKADFIAFTTKISHLDKFTK